MVQTGAGMSRFHLSCECKMQMTPSGDSLWLLLIPRAALRAGTLWPPSDAQIFSVTRLILVPLFKEHTSHRDRRPQSWLRGRCVCVLRLYESDTETALGDALFFSLSCFSCSLYLFCLLFYFYLPVHHLTRPCVHPIYVPFLLTSTSPLHLLHSAPHCWKPSLLCQLNSSSLNTSYFTFCSPFVS